MFYTQIIANSRYVKCSSRSYVLETKVDIFTVYEDALIVQRLVGLGDREQLGPC